MEFPLTLKFKILAFAPQIYVTDARGAQVLYVKQKLFKLKEAINVFSDDTQSKQIYSINADRIIDFSAKYHITNASGTEIGALKREGMKSLWKASYKVFEGEREVFKIYEENPWVKVGDYILGEIPIVGIFSGYLLNPAYLVSRVDSDQPIIRIKKEPAFLESGFSINKLDESLTAEEEERIVLAILMLVLLEKNRG